MGQIKKYWVDKATGKYLTKNIDGQDYLLYKWVEEEEEEENLKLFEFTVNNSNLVGFSHFEMDFQGLSGEGLIDVGDGETFLEYILEGTYPYMDYGYGDGSAEWTQFEYPSEGEWTVKVYYKPNLPYQDLQYARDAVFLLYLFNLRVINTLDISMFEKLSYFDLQSASVTDIIFPTTFHPNWGMQFFIYNVSELEVVDMSGSTLPMTYDNHGLTITNCPDLKSIYFPKGNDSMGGIVIFNCDELTDIVIDKNLNIIVRFQIYNCSLLSNLQITGGSNNPIRFFDMNNLPNLPYFDVKIWPNLTNISGSATWNPATWSFRDNNWDAERVNRVLVDLDTISNNEYINRRIRVDGNNAPPDSSSGGYDGLAAKASLEGKDFQVWIGS